MGYSDTMYSFENFINQFLIHNLTFEEHKNISATGKVHSACHTLLISFLAIPLLFHLSFEEAKFHELIMGGCVMQMLGL